MFLRILYFLTSIGHSGQLRKARLFESLHSGLGRSPFKYFRQVGCSCGRCLPFPTTIAEYSPTALSPYCVSNCSISSPRGTVLHSSLPLFLDHWLRKKKVRLGTVWTKAHKADLFPMRVSVQILSSSTHFSVQSLHYRLAYWKFLRTSRSLLKYYHYFLPFPRSYREVFLNIAILLPRTLG